MQDNFQTRVERKSRENLPRIFFSHDKLEKIANATDLNNDGTKDYKEFVSEIAP